MCLTVFSVVHDDLKSLSDFSVVDFCFGLNFPWPHPCFNTFFRSKCFEDFFW